jgi:hypothetical protein
MVMQCVDLPERRAHFSDPDEQATRHCRERDIALFEIWPACSLKDKKSARAYGLMMA